MDNYLRARLNDFINRSFRDLADQDYISARANYKIELYDQFLWSSLQALEKYLKGILLFYDKNTKDLSHDLVKAINRIETIPDIKWDFEDGIKEFLEYLTHYGNNRYFTYPRILHGYELYKLDFAVWYIRRYCEDMTWRKDWSKKKKADYYNSHIDYLQSEELKSNAYKFRLTSKGHIEKVLDTNKYLNQREILIWKNFYYGKKKKKRIKPKISMGSTYPAHFLLGTDIFPILEKRVKFDSKLKKYFETVKKK